MVRPVPPFIFPQLPQSWYIGHMQRALREITELTQSHSLDLIIETRDARLPLSSINPAFEGLLRQQAGHGAGIGARVGGGIGRTKRMIVYNKADLAQDCFREPLQRALAQHGDEDVLFTDSRSDAEVRRLLRAAIKLTKRPLEGPDDKITMLVAGMPNVGKSSILNALRRVGVKKGKAASTSSEPGHTRRLSTVIKIATSPPVYIYDTPGIMVPFLGKGVAGQEAALKLALTGGIKSSLFEGDVVAEYLLWRLRIRAEMRDQGWTDSDLLTRLALPPSTPLDEPSAFLTALAIRLSAIKKGGEPDVDFAGRWLIHAFREGKLGRWTLDGLGRGGEAVDDAKEREKAVKGLVVGEGEEVQWEKTERRWGYLSGERTFDEADTTPAEPTASAEIVEVDPLSLSLQDVESDSPAMPSPVSPSPSPPSASSSSPSPLDTPVSHAYSFHTTYLTSLSSSLDLRSSNQSKKAQKADQARVRDLKRRGHEVAKPSRKVMGASNGGGMGIGGKGGKGKKGFGLGWKGPMAKLSSGRRRKYRRSAS
ncbi:hypothetical protein JCM11641_003092 [Rhodosporidiobolus odoratus]